MDAAQADVRLVEPSRPVRQRVDKRNIPHAPDLRVRLVCVRRGFVRWNRLQRLLGEREKFSSFILQDIPFCPQQNMTRV